MRWPWARSSVPATLATALQPEESILATASVDEGELLAASRFGLWLVAGEQPVRWGWERISKASLRARTLSLTVADQLDSWPDGTVVLADQPARVFALASPSGLTDVVHHRVRRSVAASAHLDWPGAGGWVVLRRVPGHDGLTVQIRLDPGADPQAPGFAQAVAEQAALLDPVRAAADD